MKYFLIVSLRRCGSTYLAFEIDSYRHLFCQWEFVMRSEKHLREDHIRISGKKLSYIEEIKERCGDSIYSGSKLTIPEYQKSEVEEILKHAKKDRIKIIHITRSFSEQLISLLIAQNSGVWHLLMSKKQNYPSYIKESSENGIYGIPDKNSAKKIIQSIKKDSLKINKEDVETFCKNADLIDRQIASLKSTNPYYHIRYEDIKNEIKNVLKYISDNNHKIKFLKTKNQRIGKIIKVNHKEYVSNWDEVEPIFKKWEVSRDYRSYRNDY